jgi:Lysozyme like domain
VRKGIILFMLAAVIYAKAGGHMTLPSVPSAPMAASAGGTLSCTGLEHLWEAEGGSPSEAFTAAEIAMAESSGQQNATNGNSNGTVDRGYWQVNSVWGPLSTYDPAANARAAIQISQNGANWGPWTTYNSGAYQGKC